MKRRDFIKMSAGLGAAMATAVPLSGASAQTKMVLKASDVHPLGYPTVEAVLRMGKKLDTATSGRLTTNPASFDSRYFGPVAVSAVIGSAQPIWTW